MKKVSFFSIMLALLAVMTLASCSKDKNATPADLPANASTFIQTYFPNAHILKVEKDIDGFSKWEVDLDNGFEVEFDKNGNWTQVDGHHQQVPDGIIPSPILDYVQNNYANQFIEEIDQKRNGYKVELNNDLDLLFDPQGNFTGIDH